MSRYLADAMDVLVVHASLVQGMLFGSIIICCWLCENAIAGRSRGRKRRRAGVNAGFAAVAFPVQVGMTVIGIAAATWVAAHHWGLVYLIPGHESPWIRFGLMFIVLDLLDYVYHWAMHHVPLFWRFHLVHHTDQDVDTSTTVREHPGETLVRNCFLIVWMLVCGASLEVLVLRQTIETVANILAHTSFRLGDRMAGVLGAVFITPNLHHVHHHHRMPYTNSNYGDVFSVWDRLFGTFASLTREQTVFGLDTHATAGDSSFAAALAMPFEAAGTAIRPERLRARP